MPSLELCILYRDRMASYIYIYNITATSIVQAPFNWSCVSVLSFVHVFLLPSGNFRHKHHHVLQVNHQTKLATKLAMLNHQNPTLHWCELTHLLSQIQQFLMVTRWESNMAIENQPLYSIRLYTCPMIQPLLLGKSSPLTFKSQFLLFKCSHPFGSLFVDLFVPIQQKPLLAKSDLNPNV